VQSSLREHRKVFKLAVALGIDRGLAIAPLVNLWIWSVANAPDGVLERDPALIAFGACWPGDPDVLVRALVGAGFLDEAGDRLEIHDWDEHQQALIKMLTDQSDRATSSREKARIRMRNLRARRAEEAAPAPKAAPSRSRTLRERDANSSPEPKANIGERSPLIEENIRLEHPIPHEPPNSDANGANQLALVPVVALATASPRMPAEGAVALAAPPAAKRKHGRVPAGEPAYTAEFEEWWTSYPPRRRVGKAQTFRDYQCATLKEGASHEEIMAATASCMADLMRKDGSYDYLQESRRFLGANGKWRAYLGPPDTPPTLAQDVAFFNADRAKRSPGLDAAVRLFEAAGR